MNSTFFHRCRTGKALNKKYRDLFIKNYQDRKVLQNLNLEYMLMSICNPHFIDSNKLAELKRSGNNTANIPQLQKQEEGTV